MIDKIEALFAQGEISSEDLLLAAYLGDQAAAEMVGEEPGGEPDLATWIWGIGDRGAYPMMFLCTQLARQSLKTANSLLEDLAPEEWAAMFRFDAAKECLHTVEDYLEQPGHDDQRLINAGKSANEAARIARLGSEEASGSADFVSVLRQAAQAFEVLEQTLGVFLWTPEQVTDLQDETERKARSSAGPRHETWSAVQAAMATLGLSSDAMRELIRDILIPWRGQR